MPLPADEQGQLQEIERALYEDDPKFARRMRAGDPQMGYVRLLLQVLLGVVIGLALIPAGAATHLGYLQAVGVMIVVLLSLVWAVISWRQYVPGSGPRVPERGPGRRRGTKRRPGQTRRALMMQRMDKGWRRRPEGNGGTPWRSRGREA